MRILFVTTSKDILGGGELVSNRNYNSLLTIAGEKNVIKYSIKRNQQDSIFFKLKTLFNEIINLNFNGLNKSQKRVIIGIIIKNQIDCIFFDTSSLGFFAYQLKKKFPLIEVITYFHNVELSLAKDALKVNKNIFLFHRIIISYLSEKLICKYSDKIIVICERDAQLILRYYKRKHDEIIPVSIKDRYTPIPKKIINKNCAQKTAIFVGSYFFPNIEAIKWLINNIIPFVNIRLLLVGSNLDKLNYLVKDLSNIEIYSNVENIGYYYEQAHFALFPIFSGSGMKVKTAEALMYGKYIMGTKETFVGYDYNPKIGYCGSTKKDFIDHINHFNPKSFFNQYSRDLYLKKYSDNAVNELFKKLLER